MWNIPEVHFDQLPGRSLNNTAIPKIRVLTDQDPVLLIREAGDLPVLGVPAIWQSVHVHTVVTCLRKLFRQTARNMDVAEETHHATSPKEWPDTMSLA